MFEHIILHSKKNKIIKTNHTILIKQIGENYEKKIKIISDTNMYHHTNIMLISKFNKY